MAKKMLDKYLGFVVGAAIGDALGAPVEGLRSYQIKDRYGRVEGFIDMPLRPDSFCKKPQAKYRLSRTYTDDTQNLLLAMNYLCHNDYSFDLDNFRDYLGAAYLFMRGMGHTTRMALRAYHYNDLNPAMSERPGNGPVLRGVPFLLFCDDSDFDLVAVVSSLTHPNFSSKIGSFFYAGLVKDLILSDLGVDKFVIVRNNLEAVRKIVYSVSGSLQFEEEAHSGELLSNIGKVLENDFSEEFVIKNIGTSSRIYHSLPAAVHAFLSSDDYTTSVFNAVNLGGDADSIAAFAGGLAGARFGLDAIPYKLRNIRNYDFVHDLTVTVVGRSDGSLLDDFAVLEQRLNFEEAAIQTFIKSTISREKAHPGLKTLVDGDEIFSLAMDAGVSIDGPGIGRVKKFLRSAECGNPAVTRADEVSLIKELLKTSSCNTPRI